jgi:hypothetical protein
MIAEIDEYLKRTGQTEKDILSGLNAFGLVKIVELIVELINEANGKSKKLVFYYETDQDRISDKLSYKFE